MTIITHVKISFIITFLSGLIYINLLNFSSKCEGITSFGVVPEHLFCYIEQDPVIRKPFAIKQQINSELKSY